MGRCLLLGIAEGGPPPAPGSSGRFEALDAVDEGAHEPNFEAFHVTSADEIEAAVAQVRPCAWPRRAWATRDGCFCGTRALCSLVHLL